MPTNTPLPAAEFRRLTDDICRVAENHENMDAVQWALRMLEVTGAYRAARAASPRTLEEALMARRYITDAEYSIGHGDEAKRFKAWMDAEREHEDHARTLAEAAPVKDSLTTDPAPPDTQRGEAPTTCRWWRDEYGNWCCACSDTMPDFTPWPSTDPNGWHCPKCGKTIQHDTASPTPTGGKTGHDKP